MGKPWGTPRVVPAAVMTACIVLPSCNRVLGIDEFDTNGCELGTRECIDNAPRVCIADRTWKDGAPCVDQTCLAGECTGACAPGQARCKGNTPQHCDANAQWADGTLCGTIEHCRRGVCVVTCSPGDLRCADNQPQVCGADGQWQDNGSICAPCIGCDSNTAACAASPKLDGAACLAPDKCTLTAVCQSGNCIASTSVVCVAGRCSLGTCNPITGSCDAPDGTACDDGNGCSASSMCTAGVCNPTGDHAWAHWDLTKVPAIRFTHTPKSLVVYDNLTHLMWQRKPSGLGYTHGAASAYCDCLNGVANSIDCATDRIPGYPMGWRLPTMIELTSIVDDSVLNPSIDAAAFPDTPVGGYWTSTLDGNAPAYNAVRVEFNTGGEDHNNFDDAHFVRCVR